MKQFKKSFGERLKARRKERGFASQWDLAVELGCDQSRVSRWESGKDIPQGIYRTSLMKALAVDEGFFDQPLAPETTAPSFASAAEFLSKFEGLPPVLQKMALSIVYQDVSYVRGIKLSREAMDAMRAFLEPIKEAR